jgi:hypothetical protein
MRMSDVLRHLRQQQTETDARPRLIHRYAAFLPLTAATWAAAWASPSSTSSSRA